MNFKSKFQPLVLAGGHYDHDTGLVRFGVRDYDAEIGKWLQADPIGFLGNDTNFYSYCHNDPMNNIDPSGFKPGDEFKSEDAAAVDAIKFITPKSNKEGVEYGGYILKGKNGKYVATEPVKGTATQVNLGTPPKNATADYHTHVPSKNGNNKFRNNFSDNDISANKKLNMRGYLGTPTEGIKVNNGGFVLEGL